MHVVASYHECRWYPRGARLSLPHGQRLLQRCTVSWLDRLQITIDCARLKRYRLCLRSLFQTNISTYVNVTSGDIDGLMVCNIVRNDACFLGFNSLSAGCHILIRSTNRVLG